MRIKVNTLVAFDSKEEPFILIFHLQTAFIMAVAVHYPEIYFCFCVNANQYIEQALPDIELFRRHHVNIVLGTDSLTSNHQLSILEEIKTIHHHFSSIPLENMMQWATINGAKALEIENIVGSFSPGKTPGIILIENLESDHVGQQSSVKKLG